MITALFLASTLGSANIGQEAILDQLQHRAVDFFWNESNPRTGFTKDRAANLTGADKYDVASIASIGFALSAYPIGVERHWLDKGKAKERTLLTLNSILSKLDTHKGWYYHFINWETGKRVWNCELSSIDTSIMLAGVLVADRYWNDGEISRLSNRIVGGVDWKWMMTDGGAKPDEPFLSMGWKPEDGFIKARWSSFCELAMIYVQAYGADPTLRNDGWDKVNREPVNYKGYTLLAGGPLFMHQMSNGFYDFGNKRDRLGYNYWFETQQATWANRAYCIENPKKFKAYGPDFWGLSACDSPDGYSAFGAPNGDDNGTITPTSAIASMPYTPRESKAFAESMYANHKDAWGRYGFSNGVCPQRNWVDPDVIGIDLGMMLTGVEDYRSGLIWKLSMSHPVVKRGFDRMGFRSAPGSNKGPLRAP